jgi:hypothetical protein
MSNKNFYLANFIEKHIFKRKINIKIKVFIEWVYPILIGISVYLLWY